ncbi:MAG: RNA polymerase sigma factor [Thermoanaerobaculia bacterium]
MTDPSREGPDTDRIEDLVTQIQAGVDVDRNFEELFKHFQPQLIGFLLSRGLRRELCEEITQEAFSRVFTEIKGFERRSSFKTWLFSIVKNLYLNERRRNQASKRDGREVPLEEEMGPETEERRSVAPALVSPEPGADAEVLRREQSAKLRKEVEEMPPQMQRCFLLRVYQDLKYREIAVVMDIKLDTVKAHLGQARARLERELGGGQIPARLREDDK